MNVKRHNVRIGGRAVSVKLSQTAWRIFLKLDDAPSIQDFVDRQERPSGDDNVSEWLTNRIFRVAADELEHRYSKRCSTNQLKANKF